MRTIYYLLMCQLLSGCASVWVSNLSSEPAFSQYIGQDFLLKNNGLLCKSGYLGDEHEDWIEGNELVLHHQETCHYGDALEKIPVGTTIHITKIEEHHMLPPLVKHIYFKGIVKISLVTIPSINCNI